MGYRSNATAPSASVLKAMLLVAYLDHPSVRNRSLRGADRRLISPMVRRSDNPTATRIRRFVGARRFSRLARRAGMRHFSPAPTQAWGHSRISAEAQARFFLGIDRYVVARDRATAMRLLRTVVTSQRWGVGRVAPRGWRLYFKGGWGSGTGAVDHQVALLMRGRARGGRSTEHRPGDARLRQGDPPGCAALAAFKTIARQVARDGVTLNTLLTGRIATDRIAEISGSIEAAQEAASTAVPAGRLGTVEEYAAVAAFLCSERASFVTGAAVPVDGGLLQSV